MHTDTDLVRQSKTVMTFKKVPVSIWMLGFISLLSDMASELNHSILPLYMVSTLHASVLTVGIIEGVAQATMLFMKIISGFLSDYFGNRKVLTVIGYSVAAFSKILFPLSRGVPLVFFAHTLDRAGKGIRGAPRDALIADLTPAEVRGMAFGLRQALDTTGAIIGPLLAVVLICFTACHFRTLMWIAVVPAVCSVLLLIFGIQEPTKNTKHTRTRLSLAHILSFKGNYWWILGVTSFLSLARFSEAFLILKAQSLHMSLMGIPLIFVVMNTSYALVSTPAGYLSDRIDRRIILGLSLVFLLVADLILAFAANVVGLMLGMIAWGLHMGFSEGVLAALITDNVPDSLRGTAFGLFHFVCGICMLCASVFGGFLWDAHGASSLFLAGCVFVSLSIICLLLWCKLKKNGGCVSC